MFGPKINVKTEKHMDKKLAMIVAMPNVIYLFQFYRR
jgi:hypothetical protein